MSTDFYRGPEFNDPIPEPKAQRQFKILDLLALVAIIAVLIAFFLPAVRSGGRHAAYRAQCTNNLKQIALALRMYEKEHNTLPPAYTIDAQGRPLHSWRTLILPYLEHEQLYDSIDLSKPWNDPINAKALESSIPVFRCPLADEPRNATSYLAVVAPNGCFMATKGRRLADITDDHNSTLMLIEAGEESAVPWMAPIDADESLVLNLAPNAKLRHPGGVNAATVNGSVRFLRASTSADLRRAILSISGHDDRKSVDW